jgi:hypothetical protein
MQLSRFLFFVAAFLLPLCLLSTTWLYLYPLFHGCGFPVPEPSPHAINDTAGRLPSSAPFRLLALGDPQLEGDTSLPDPNAAAFPALQYFYSDFKYAASWERRRDVVLATLRKVFKRDLVKLLKGYRKRVDLWGNDFYLAHIVRQLRWWTEPTHVSVLGDLLGSQWISDEEFEKRAGRFWGTVFKGMERVEDDIMWSAKEEGKQWGEWKEVLGEDKRWGDRVINIAGNHDVGYAGDLDEGRVERFEKAFGRVNWDMWFEHPRPSSAQSGEGEEGREAPALRIVVLNSMNLDTPALSADLQRSTYDYMNHLITTSRSVSSKNHATILLTHIPLHKEAGICVDEPFFDFFDSGAGVEEQNMLSDYASKTLLEGIFGLSGNPYAEAQGLGRSGIIINGHDHEGCDTLHYISKTPFDISHPLEGGNEGYTSPANASDIPEWRALRTPSFPTLPLREFEPFELGKEGVLRDIPTIREITLRSMMGDFSGYAGFLSAWFDESIGAEGEWRIEFQTCGLGVQHWWWVVHSVDFAAVVVLALAVLAKVIETIVAPATKDKTKVIPGLQEGSG